MNPIFRFIRDCENLPSKMDGFLAGLCGGAAVESIAFSLADPARQLPAGSILIGSIGCFFFAARGVKESVRGTLRGALYGGLLASAFTFSSCGGCDFISGAGKPDAQQNILNTERDIPAGQGFYHE